MGTPKHGRFGTKEYTAWIEMRRRCNSKHRREYVDYAGRSIEVCELWQTSFEAFFKDMGMAPSPMHQLDRIDNDKGYFPGNVRWALPKENARNRRNNMLLAHQGRIQCLAAWAEEVGIDSDTIRKRIKKWGWSIARALSQKVS
jgi:hypothetical protein